MDILKYEEIDLAETIKRSEQDVNNVLDTASDILNNVKAYISKKPKYKSKYYSTGYPNDEYGVCTDVVAFGLLDAGYDLMELVNEDITNNRNRYNIKVIDKKISGFLYE